MRARLNREAYLKLHRSLPRGCGKWAFKFKRDGEPIFPVHTLEIEGDFGAAVAAARQYAKDVGADEIVVQR